MILPLAISLFLACEADRPLAAGADAATLKEFRIPLDENASNAIKGDAPLRKEKFVGETTPMKGWIIRLPAGQDGRPRMVRLSEGSSPYAPYDFQAGLFEEIGGAIKFQKLAEGSCSFFQSAL